MIADMENWGTKRKMYRIAALSTTNPMNMIQSLLYKESWNDSFNIDTNY
jgi:hypothetical protein